MFPRFSRILPMSTAILTFSLTACNEPIAVSEPDSSIEIMQTTATMDSSEADITTMLPTVIHQSSTAPASYYIYNVPFQTQEGLLPTGCELISSLMLLKYWNINVTIDDIIAHTPAVYPDKKQGKTCAPSPYQAFIGSPTDPTSFGCFSPVIVPMLESFVDDSFEVIDTTGKDLEELAKTYLPLDIPILVWATGHMKESCRQIGWYLTDDNGQPTDEWYYWPAGEHCLLLVGYDEESYYFHDPMLESSPTVYEKQLVETRYAELDKMSVVILPKYLSE